MMLSVAMVAGCDSSDNANVSGSANPTGYEATIILQANGPQVAEGDAGASIQSFVLTLSAPPQSSFDVSYVTEDGTAIAGQDYEYRKGLVTFDAGDTQKTVDIQILGDQLDEADEDLKLKLATDSGVNIATPTAIATIQDDDDPPTISVDDASVTEGNAGLRKLLFPITLSTASGKEISAEFGTENGVAVTPDDYLQTNGQLTLKPGITSSVVSVRVLGDTSDEGDEDFVLRLQNVENATLLDDAGLGTIINDDPVSGLQQRPVNANCIAPDKPTVNTSIDTGQVFSGVGTFNLPIALTLAPNDSSQWYVVEKDGLVFRFDNDLAASASSLFIDISSIVDSSQGESGLLGIAFHPDYAMNRYVFLSYTATGPDGTYLLTSRLSRFESLDDGLTLDPGTEVILMSQDQRYPNHNGGNIAFGPDGYLYYGLGDSGSGGDPGNRAQNTKNLFGAISRIDVDSGPPYGIPADNPFSGNGLCDVSTTGMDSPDACPEIYAWGLRNPWRWSFDSGTGLLWLADVGQGTHEEVDVIELGGNYGWRIQEGFACFNPSSDCDTSGLIQPILTYDHTVGRSITGGYVYRGTEIPELIGRYVFADYSEGKLFATILAGGGAYSYEQLADTSLFIPSFAEDADGELYFLNLYGGTIHRISQFGGTSVDTIPAALSDTGCVDALDVTVPAPELIPYDTNVSFWSDGATKDRFYAIPDGTSVDVDVSGNWMFPVGTVLVKNFRLFGSLVETRHMMRHTNGEWAGYTYEWNEDETEAIRVVGGKTKDVNGQTWIFPSEAQCMMCHTSAAEFSLGPEHAQLNRDFLYPDTGITANQLFTADAIDVLTEPLPNSQENLPSLAGLAAGGYVLDFNLLPTTSYSNQDEYSNVAVRDGGLTFEIADNSARKTDRTFNITSETVLEFDFESTGEVEIHGIGFDENDVHDDDVRYFALYGTQAWIGSNQDFNNYAGGGPKHYVIPVGRYYTGSDMHLVFVNDNDAGTGIGGNSRFSNVKIIGCPTCLDFDLIQTSSYSNQDQIPNVTIENDGSKITLQDNSARKTVQTFDITATTYLSFDFESTVEGEIHGIGFDENNDHDDDIRYFSLHGTQFWNGNNPDFNNYPGAGLVHYQIPVGKYYTGSAMRMVFINDDDTNVGSNSSFSNVKVVDCPDCLDFTVETTSSYDNQDLVGNVALADVGATLVLSDNTWRRTDATFDVTVDTVLEFDFESPLQGEVQGIGLDENDIWGDDVRIFKLYGSQNSTEIMDFNTYQGVGQIHYRIPVGQYYTGSAMSLVFANDDDANLGGVSRFSNVQIHERPIDTSTTPTVQDQVRSYLHVNCAGCHRPSGPTPSIMDLRFNTKWPEMNVCDVIPTLGALGVANARIIAPGDSARSILVNRMNRRDAYAMPPLGSHLVDAGGVDLLTTWIDSMDNCPQ